ncbi:Neprilysin-4 [Lamellibrachia satsuma]|nr:Neprilysin-4 [Lamellibrachia satsuma]
MPSNRASYSTFGKLRDEVGVKVKDLLESPVDAKEPNSVTKAKMIYRSCMNTTLINERDISPLQLTIHGLGGWPVIHPTWDKSKYDLNELVAKVNMLGKNALWQRWVSADDRKSGSNIIQFDQAGLGLPSRDYFLDPRYTNQLNAYRRFTTEVAIALGGDHNDSARDMNAMVDFEISLANITVPAALRRNLEAMYNKYTVNDLTNKVTNAIDWGRYLKLQFDKINVTIDGSQDVVVYSPEFFKHLATLLGNTPKRTVANYVIWKVVHSSVYHLSDTAFRDIKQRYRQALSGTNTAPPRWTTCVAFTTGSVNMVVGRLFVEKYFRQESETHG